MAPPVGRSALGRGFADPVRDAQASFRRILTALSEPGTIEQFDSLVEVPVALSTAATIVMLALADHDTPVWLPQTAADASRYIGFHTGAPITSDERSARFAVVDGGVCAPGLDAFDPGDDRYPDRSATVIVECKDLMGGPSVRLSGPGIRGSREIAPRGLHAGFWASVLANAARYPVGVDIILASGNAIMGLPRSTRVVTDLPESL